MNTIYLDANATTPLLPSVWEAMQPLALEAYGNPASAHHAGRKARQALEAARERVAALLDAFPDEVVFTSGATESNNLALQGLLPTKPCRIVVSPLEHPSISETVRHLAAQGHEVVTLPVTSLGVVALETRNPLLDCSGLITVMLANNETGAIQPIQDLRGRFSGEIPFHCDAAQAVGRIRVRFHELGVTTLAFTAHKFHGPRGIGGLLVRRGTRLQPQLYGGHQQAGRRPGTESAALAFGLAEALDRAENERAARIASIRELRRRLLAYLQSERVSFVINGPIDGGVPHTLNLSFPGCRADTLLMALDLEGVACSTGSACSSGSLLPSPVLRAMGITGDRLNSALRFSLHPFLTLEEIEEGARRIVRVVRRLRELRED